MRTLALLFILFPLPGFSQLIFDYGFGFEAGTFRLSESRKFYELDTLAAPNLDLDTSKQFYIKAPHGVKFGIQAITSCTLTSPDKGMFFTVTGHLVAQFGSFDIYYPRFIHAPGIPDITWEVTNQRKKYTAYFAVPVLLNANYMVSDYTFYAGIGMSYAGYAVVNGPADIFFVADHQFYGDQPEEYSGYYIPRGLVQLETRAGIILATRGRLQNEFFGMGSFGAGRMLSLQFGYAFRFSFYNG